MAFSLDPSSRIVTAARAALVSRSRRLGIEAQIPPQRKLTLGRIGTGLLWHSAYWLQDKAARIFLNDDSSPSRQEERVAQFATVDAPSIFSSILFMGTQDGLLRGEGVDVLAVADKIMTYITTNRSKHYSRDELSRRYKDDFDTKLPETVCQAAINQLALEKRIEINEDGTIQYYNQEAKIKSISAELSTSLSGVGSLHALARKVSENVSKLFLNFDIYLKDGKTEQMLIVAGDAEASSYRTWAEIEAEGIFSDLLRQERPVDRLRHVKNIVSEASDQGPIFKHQVEKYMHRYSGNLGEVLYLAHPINDGNGITVKINEWNKEGGRNRVLYSENLSSLEEVNGVNDAVRGLVSTIGTEVQSLLARKNCVSIKALWEKEEDAMRTVAVQSRPIARLMDLNEELSFWTAYSEFIHVFLGSRDVRTISQEVANLLRIEEKNKVVFAGCGIGNEMLVFSDLLAEQGKQGVKFIGFDVTPAMIDRARKNPKLAGIEFSVNDWCGPLPYESGSIDKVASVLVFGYLANPEKALAETLRILKPGGVFSLTVPVPNYNSTLIFLRGVWHSFRDRGLRITLKDIPYGLKCLKSMREIRKKIKQGIYNGYLPESLTQALEKAGFHNITAFLSKGSKYFTVAAATKPNSPGENGDQRPH